MITIQVSKQGVDVLGTTTPNDLIFDSNLNTFKILESGTVNATFPNDQYAEQTTQYAHGLGYTPFVIPFCKLADGRVVTPGYLQGEYSVNQIGFTRVTVDNTYINFGFVNSSGSNYSVTFRYFIVEPPL